MMAASSTKVSSTQSLETIDSTIKVQKHEHLRITLLTLGLEPKHKEADYCKHLWYQ